MKRIVTAVAMAVVMVPILIWGGVYHIFDAFVLLLAGFGAWEMRRMTAKARPQPLWIDLLAALLCGGVYLAVRFAVATSGVSLAAGVLGLVLSGGILLVAVDGFGSDDFGNLLAAAVYPGVGFAAVAVLRDLDLFWVVYVLVAAMVTDSAAYSFGTRFGRHRLCPRISPKKSIEGAIAGSVFGTAAGTAFALLLNLFPAGTSWILVVLVSFALTVVSQTGDLVASKLKRSHGIKDFSNLFPGHGGVLDRFDSSIFAAAFLLLVLLVAGVAS
jgi:phosphatidate cytidylyltransferase